MKALAELLTICAAGLTIGGFAVRYLMDRLGRKKLPPESNRDYLKRLEQENRELDEMLDNLRRTEQREKE